MENKKRIEAIRNGMLLQDKRGTSWPIFIVVEDQKIYGVDPNFSSDGAERKEIDGIDRKNDLCDECRKIYEDTGTLPEQCNSEDAYLCDDSFVSYRIEKDVPNMRAAFFFTAQACNEHIEANRHHYNKTAHSYAISAYHNSELQAVMVELIGEANTHKLQ